MRALREAAATTYLKELVPLHASADHPTRKQLEVSNMYQNILVPLDGSATSARGLDEAIKLAQSLHARIRLFHVVNELVVLSPEVAATAFTQVVDLLRSRGEQLLEEAEAAVRKAGIPVDSGLTEAMGGQAGDYVVQEAKTWPASLIVCGTHGRRGLRRALMGSDAEHIIRSSPVPVLLVRSDQPG
jgi:nucleotide-binding universal stress UspA family protein